MILSHLHLSIAEEMTLTAKDSLSYTSTYKQHQTHYCGVNTNNKNHLLSAYINQEDY